MSTSRAKRRISRIAVLFLLIPLITTLSVVPSSAAVVKLRTPGNVTPALVPGSSTSISVSFTEPDNGIATSFTVFVYSSSDSYGSIVKTQTNYIKPNPITGLTEGATYKVKVQAIGTGNYSNSNVSQLSQTSVTLAGLATPSAPTVAATSNTLKSINVSWSAITNASSYTLRLYSSIGSLITTTGLAGLTGTSATITTTNYSSLADNTAYKVSITAIGNGSTYSDSSESAKSDVTTNAAPGTPTITVQPTNQSTESGSTATFSVTATSPDSGTLGYQWQVSTDSGSNWANVSSGTGGTTNSYTTISLIRANNNYQYRVAVTNTKNGATSAAVNSSPATLTVAKANQAALSPPVLSATTAAYNGSAYSQALTVTTGGGGSGNGTLSITGVADGSATGCSFSSGTLTASTSGTCILTVTKASDSEYNAVSTTATFTFNKASQSALSFTLDVSSSAGRVSAFSQALSITSYGGSGDGAITYAIAAGGTASTCALANNTASNTITATSVGTCLIQATKASDSNYDSTTSSTVTFTFTRAISTDNNLGSLTILPGTISPTFSSSSANYSISISSTVTTLTLTASPSSQYATMTLNGLTLLSNTPTTVSVDLNSANQLVTIRVTAEDLSTRDYVISVVRVIIDKSSTVLSPNVAPTPSTPPSQSTNQIIQTPSASVLPRITSTSTTSGPVGTVVTITGTGFSSLLSVKLNGVNITPTNPTLITSTSITVTIPAGARSGTIAVTTSKGSASTPRFTVTI